MRPPSTGLVDTGWSGYGPAASYPHSYLGSSLPACPTHHTHHLTPTTTHREGAAPHHDTLPSASHLNFLTDHLGPEGTLTVPKDLLAATPPALPPSVSVATSLGILGGGASVLGGGVSMLGGGGGGGAGILGGGGGSMVGGVGGGSTSVYLTQPLLPASLLYSSLCSALPHPSTATPPPTPTRPSPSTPLPSLHLASITPQPPPPRPPDPVWRPY
ncbi:hypothetical protein Pmani_028075 [Petrolisthes manimaculis]|uniref:Uncharacterized protein n=1 Tax=Petrolisthes manimaculis TaxID=1843537 RepID=A0AAE1P2D4_9EUCA|nr:hypothetical protein Pmani_028075 [Petrolisthes manimaculis]